MKSDSMLDLNAFDLDQAERLDPVERLLVERRQKTFGKGIPLFYRQPVNVVRASGVWLFDHLDREYLDAYNNVPSVGHCHPHVVNAVAHQAARLNTHTRYLSDVVSSYAERLLSTFAAPLSRVLFTTSGTESIDLALRMARCHTGGSGIIVTRFAYHGHSAAVAEITPAFGSGIPLGQHVRTVPAPDGYRGDSQVGANFAHAVGTAIADLERHGIRFAALVADSIFSSDGLFVDPAGFLVEAVEKVRAAGGVYIADEVQPGFGRTGCSMWGFARHAVQPDMVVMGKPMGNGMPIAAVVVRPDILDSFSQRTAYFNTFGGNTVCCAAASAVLDVIENEGLIARAGRVGAYLKRGFLDLQQRHPAIGDVRGAGLYLAVDIVKPDGARTPDTAEALRLVNALRERRILISTCGEAGNVLKIRPPLQFAEEHCDLLLTSSEDLLGRTG
jgi:4-aminobutyrate aminotransferase-like enzyme